MPLLFSVLASGSRGNSSLVRTEGAGLLIDLGLGPRTMAKRMAAVGAGWEGIAVAVLTHTHGDHVQDATLRTLAARGIPFYCHEGHHRGLARFPGFLALKNAGCVRIFDDRPFLAPHGHRVEPIELSHDGGPTFGFRVEARPRRKDRPVTVGYVADTGCWTGRTADALADVDVLGVEFNHDEEMQRSSGRAPYLIARNLGNRGHLSNAQGAALVEAVLERSHGGAVRHVVLLHLSEQCNLPGLALDQARAAVKAAGRKSRVFAAEQWSPHPHLPVAPSRKRPGPSCRVAAFPWEDQEPLFRLAE